MPTIQEFVKWGLDREVPELLEGPRTIHEDGAVCFRDDCGGRPLRHINLGPGDKKVIPATVGVGPHDNKLTDIAWIWQGLSAKGEIKQPLPFDDESVGAVHVHQFMEHFDGENAMAILWEIQRVLVPGGVIFMTTPYPGHGHFTQALDHKSMWTEETWQWLLTNPYYTTAARGINGPWRLKVHACFMLGVVYRNLDLFTQLVKQ